MEKDNSSSFFKILQRPVEEKDNSFYFFRFRPVVVVKEWAALVMAGAAREKELVVPLNERFLGTRNAKFFHEPHIEDEDEEPNDEEDEEPNGGGDSSGYVEFGNVQPSAYEEYDANGRALGLNFDGYYSEGDSVSNDGVNGSDGDGPNKSGSSSVNLSGTPYGYPYRYR